jgi:molecular chaperone DnaK (HSP70)
MVSEAEKYKEEDEKQKERIVARNQLENYIFSVKQAVGDSGDKLSNGSNIVESTINLVKRNHFFVHS